MGTSSASIPQNQRESPLPAGLSRWRSGIAVGHVTEGSWVRFPLENHFFQRGFSVIISHHLCVCVCMYIYIWKTGSCARQKQCSMPHSRAIHK